MQRHIDNNNYNNRYFTIAMAVFAFFMTCVFSVLAIYILISLSAMSQQ